MTSRRIGASVLLAVALAAGSGCTVTPEAADPATTSSRAPDTTIAPSPVTAARRVGAVVPEAPVSLKLPDGTRVHVRSVSTTRNGVLDVPAEIKDAGWWRGGSKIGDPFGSTLIAAHVDSRTEGLGPFAELLSVRPGQRVSVLTKTLKQTFRVTSRRLRPRGSISERSSLHSPDGTRRLTLVTCASPYVVALGGYQNLAVIVATPLGEPVPRMGR